MEEQQTLDKCPVCEKIGFRIFVDDDFDDMYICLNCGVCLWKDELVKG